VPWLLVEGQQKMLADFAKLLPFRKRGKTNNFMMSFFPTIITKEILGRDVALTNFVGKIAIVVARR
jgi:hypothetical protein